MERDGLGVFEVLVLVLAGAALLVVGVVWAGAALALLLSGAPQGVTFSAAADATGGLSRAFARQRGLEFRAMAIEIPRLACQHDYLIRGLCHRQGTDGRGQRPRA